MSYITALVTDLLTFQGDVIYKENHENNSNNKKTRSMMYDIYLFCDRQYLGLFLTSKTRELMVDDSPRPHKSVNTNKKTTDHFHKQPGREKCLKLSTVIM